MSDLQPSPFPWKIAPMGDIKIGPLPLAPGEGPRVVIVAADNRVVALVQAFRSKENAQDEANAQAIMDACNRMNEILPSLQVASDLLIEVYLIAKEGNWSGVSEWRMKVAPMMEPMIAEMRKRGVL